MARPLYSLLPWVAGILVSNLFFTQLLLDVIAPDLGLGGEASGLVATTTMLGYAVGLVLVTPLSDLVENRILILSNLLCTASASAVAAFSQSKFSFLLALFAIGVSSCVIQIVTTLATFLAPDETRGRVIGGITSGLMLGILLSRPVGSVIAGVFGWRAVYAISAGLALLLAVVLSRILPRRRPGAVLSYAELVLSMVTILHQEQILRRRAIYAALCIGTFNLFWTTIAFRLAAPPFNLGHYGIALFAFAGVAGAIVAPLAGRVGDRGGIEPGSKVAHITLTAAMLLLGLGGTGWMRFDPMGSPGFALGLLLFGAVLLDCGVVGDQTLGRCAINLLRPEIRGRVNGLFTATYFVGGAAGAALGGLVWSSGSWSLVCAFGFAVGVVTLVLDLAGWSRWRPQESQPGQARPLPSPTPPA